MDEQMYSYEEIREAIMAFTFRVRYTTCYGGDKIWVKY